MYICICVKAQYASFSVLHESVVCAGQIWGFIEYRTFICAIYAYADIPPLITGTMPDMGCDGADMYSSFYAYIILHYTCKLQSQYIFMISCLHNYMNFLFFFSRTWNSSSFKCLHWSVSCENRVTTSSVEENNARRLHGQMLNPLAMSMYYRRLENQCKTSPRFI